MYELTTVTGVAWPNTAQNGAVATPDLITRCCTTLYWLAKFVLGNCVTEHKLVAGLDVWRPGPERGGVYQS